jgi:hypothetical protein
MLTTCVNGSVRRLARPLWVVLPGLPHTISKAPGLAPTLPSHVASAEMNEASGACYARGLLSGPGSVLLSHTVAHAVPSAPKSLTSEFGMGSGMASSISPPEIVGVVTDSLNACGAECCASRLRPGSYARIREGSHARAPGASCNDCLSEYGQAARPISTG